jgi:hypothetical protein
VKDDNVRGALPPTPHTSLAARRISELTMLSLLTVRLVIRGN